MNDLAISASYHRGNETRAFQCTNSTIIKIVVLVAGLMVLAAGLSMYFINLNSIAAIYPIASYATMGAGCCLILGTAIYSVVDWLRGEAIGTLESEEVHENDLDAPILIQDNLTAWKERFKSSALIALANPRVPSEVIPCDLALTPDQETCLRAVIQDLDTRYKTDKATIHSEGDIWVFSMSEAPGRIFKMRRAGAVVKIFRKDSPLRKLPNR